MWPWDHTQVILPGGGCFYLLNHLASPKTLFPNENSSINLTPGSLKVLYICKYPFSKCSSICHFWKSFHDLSDKGLFPQTLYVFCKSLIVSCQDMYYISTCLYCDLPSVSPLLYEENMPVSLSFAFVMNL
nr:unnamed protein product [Mus musculus]